MTSETYSQLLSNKITITYNLGSSTIEDDINQELEVIADNLGIESRIEPMAKRQSSISRKDHKENFEHNPKCKLINPAKSEIGRVRKVILDEINSGLRSISQVSQWRNSVAVNSWFKNVQEKHNHTFLLFDIVDFYPSITKDLLNKAISWASNQITITDQQIKIIKHARKSLLFNEGKPWVKKETNGTFDVTVGSYDGAEVCELVGLFMLDKLGERFEKEDIGVYRDDDLATLKNVTLQTSRQIKRNNARDI